jgi:hypothetical protein
MKMVQTIFRSGLENIQKITSHWLRRHRYQGASPYGSATGLPFCRAMQVKSVSVSLTPGPSTFACRDPQAFTAKAPPNPLDVFGWR